MTEPIVAPVVVPPVIDPGVKPWYDGAEAEVVGHIENKGWKDKDPKAVALEAIKAHREAEKFIGVPSSQVLKVPTDATDEAGWKALWTKLGAPANGKEGYDFTTIKAADGSALASPTLDTVRNIAAELQLPKDTATRLAASLVKAETDRSTAELADKTAKLELSKQALAANWGANAPIFKNIASNAAAAFGLAPETVTALEGVVGYDKVMDFFLKVGQQIGEAKFVTVPNGGNGGPGIMTVDGAKSRKAELMGDTAWVSRYNAGDTAAFREMMALNTIIVG